MVECASVHGLRWAYAPELEAGEYRKVTISMLPKLKKLLDLTVAMSDTTQVEFMISAIEPKIEECMERFSLDV